MQIKQFVPAEYCSKCDVCCRFLDEETPLAPTGIPLVAYNDRFICKNFDPVINKCKDYENRPLDCQLYPLVVMWDEDYRNIVLGIDPKCPYASVIARRLKANEANPEHGIASVLTSTMSTPRNDVDPSYILRFQDDIEILEKLDIKPEPVLNKLLIGDKALFEKYAAQTDRLFSSYSFIANYIWTRLLNYYWTIIDDNFCLFCKTKDTIFMPIPPIPPRRCPVRTPTRCTFGKKVVGKSFELMNKLNKNKNCSRIEDIGEKDVKFFKDLGYKIKEKGCEYIYRQKDLANLAGDRYKAKRALCNYFEKNYRFDYRKLRQGDRDGCLTLFKMWQASRVKGHHKDDYYKALLEDSYTAHKKAMDKFQDLGLAGRVVVVDNKISAYTFGYTLDNKTFVILFEIADLKIKGLSQFIFREFCREAPRLNEYEGRGRSVTYINLMDDSGLENLKKVKLSYHPVKIEKMFCAYE